MTPTLSQRFLAPLALAAAFAAPLSLARAQPAGAFSSLAGAWSGEGTIRLSNNAVERVRCQADYAVDADGRTLNDQMRCASGGDRFDFRIQLEDRDGAIVGNWREVTRQVEGGVSGRGGSRLIQATARGQAFSANVTLATRGARQNVDIRSSGSDLRTISLVLSRVR